MYGYYIEDLQGLHVKQYATLEETKRHYDEDKNAYGVLSLSPIYRTNFKNEI